MRKREIILTSLWLACAGTFAETLVAWDGGSTTNTAVQKAGVEGTLWVASIYEVDASAGSTDGTFGPAITGAVTTATGYSVRLAIPGSTDTLGMQVLNNTGSDLRLDSIAFDYHPWFANSPKTVTLSYSWGDLDVVDETVINSISGLDDSTGGKLSDYQDFDWSLAGLSDVVLADGEKANFQLVVSDAIGASTGGAFDNVALVGSGPGSIRLIGLTSN